MKEAFPIAFFVLLLGSGLAGAAPSDPPPPPPPPGADNPGNPNRPPDRERDRDHRRGFSPSGDRQQGFFSGGGDHGDHGDLFRHLSEEERQKVRSAFEKAWKNPAVTQARVDLMKANDQYRNALQQAIREADPEVAKILDRVKTDSPQGGHPRFGLGPMPDTADPEFVHKALQRLPLELQVMMQGPGDRAPGDRGPGGDRGERGPGDRGPGERGDRGPGDRMERHEPSPQVLKLHEKLMQLPEVVAAVKDLEQSDTDHKMEAWKHLRESYQTAAKAEVTKLRESTRSADSGAPAQDTAQPK